MPAVDGSAGGSQTALGADPPSWSLKVAPTSVVGTTIEHALFGCSIADGLVLAPQFPSRAVVGGRAPAAVSTFAVRFSPWSTSGSRRTGTVSRRIA